MPVCSANLSRPFPGGAGFGNQEREFYTTRSENAALDGNGHLVITIRADDQRLSLFEYTLRWVLHRHLDAQFLPQRQTRPMHSAPQKLAHSVATVLGLLAWEGQPEPDQAARAFDAGMRGYIGGDHTHRLPPREECSLAEFDAALQTLKQSVPAIKRRIVVACAACILANQQVTVREAELLRAIGDTLECPLPPLVVGEAEGRGRTLQPGGL